MIDERAEIDPANASRELVHPLGRERPVIVLIHGLTATPQQYGRLAPALYAAGANVLIPRLPRHGYRDRMTDALAELRAPELIATVDGVLERARELGGPIRVAGFSLGGNLASWIAQFREVERAVAIAPFLGMRRLPRRAHKAARVVIHAAPNFFLWWHPLRRENHGGRDGYPRFATKAIAAALSLAEETGVAAAHGAPLTRNVSVILNAEEPSCNNRVSRDLALRWQQHGATVALRELRDIGPRHDFLTPSRRPVPAAEDVIRAALL